LLPCRLILLFSFFDGLIFGDLVLFELLLHISDSISIKFALDLRRGLDHIKIFKELVERNHALLQILNADGSIVVKIESEPVLVCGDRKMRVSLGDIGGDLDLSVC